MSRILLVSDPAWAQSGYGRLGRALAKRMQADGHEVAIFSPGGALGGDEVVYDGIRILPAAFGDDRWGNNTYKWHLAREEPDLVVTLLDGQGLHAWGTDPVTWWAWAPIDSWPVHPEEQGILGLANRVLVPTRWGQAQLLEAGIPSTYVPYAIDTEEHQFDPQGRKRFREKIGVADDEFLIGMVGINYPVPDRKGFPYAFEAIKLVSDQHPRVKAWLHCMSQFPGAIDLRELRTLTGLDGILGMSDIPVTGDANTQDMRAMYSAFDVLLQASLTEGFGLPVVEAEANGCPVVVNGATALTELAGPFCHIAEPAGHQWTIATTKISIPSAKNLAEGLGKAYTGWQHMGPRWTARDLSRWATRYDRDYCYAVYWRPMLEQIEPPLSFSDEIRAMPKVQLGTGRVPVDGWIHHDRTKHAEFIDVAHDLETFPWPWADSSLGQIHCADVLEHLRGSIPQVLDECWRVLAPGGWLTITTCQTGSWMHSYDPTHVRGFDLHSFDYFDPDLPLGKRYGMEVGQRTWRVVRRGMHGGEIEILMQSRKEPAAISVADAVPERVTVAAG